ncbi:MAG: alpha/beta hydrolase, partial [Pseudomonadota bacterium]
RDYPEMTRSVILDAPAMPEIRTTEASNFQLSLNRLVEECAAAPICSDLYPDLETKFYTAVDNLNMDPAAVDIQFEGSTETVFVSGDRFVLGLQNAFNSNSLLPLIPIAIDNVAAGDLAIVQAVAPDLLTAFESISWGHFASVDCAENNPFWSEAQRMQSNANVNPLISAALDPVSHGVDVGQCEFWDVQERPSIAGEAVLSDIPALILHGDYDVAIPLSYSEKAAENLSNSQLVVFPGFGHVVLGQDFNVDGTSCGQRILAQFLDDPMATVDTSCLAEFPPLYE